jgi:K+-transporting ATPase ATPase C chain
MQHVRPAIVMLVLMTLLTGLLYPLGFTALVGALFPRQAAGSLVTIDGKVIGSELIGQNFAAAQYFHGRPSAAGNGYDAANSSGSNFATTSRTVSPPTPPSYGRKIPPCRYRTTW